MSKQRVIVEAVLSGKSQREVARLYGVSQPRVSQLVAAWRAGGWDALEPRSRRPHSSPSAIRGELVTPQPRKRPTSASLRFEADLPNECWQSDFTHWSLVCGNDAEILIWLDDHSAPSCP